MCEVSLMSLCVLLCVCGGGGGNPAVPVISTAKGACSACSRCEDSKCAKLVCLNVSDSELSVAKRSCTSAVWFPIAQFCFGCMMHTRAGQYEDTSLLTHA